MTFLRAQVAAFSVLLATLAFGQAPAFDAASVKPSTAQPGSSSAVRTDRGRIEARNVTLKRCIRSAYGVPEAQIFGGPKWADEDRYDIDAKATGPAGDHELSVMLRSLLAERFKLAFHRETRALPGYALVAAKGGLTAKPSEPDGPSSTNATRTSIDAKRCSMAQLALKLSEVLHLPVADSTGIEGAYDFHLEFIAEDLQARTASTSDAPAPGTSLFAVLQQQLGLKLDARKVPTEVLVIDRAERPSEN